MSSFFHTLVVFGAGASLAGCGAKVTGDESGGQGGSYGGQQAGGGDVSIGVKGGAPGTGGSGNSMASGGAFGAGGFTTGGAPSTGGAAGAGGLDPATLPQLTCDGRWEGCTRVATDAGVESFYLLSGSCTVDPTRPRSEADCPATQRFECVRALLGVRFVAVECHCVATPLDGSCDDCAYQGSEPRAVSGVCKGRTKLCGCVTGILVK